VTLPPFELRSSMREWDKRGVWPNTKDVVGMNVGKHLHVLKGW